MLGQVAEEADNKGGEEDIHNCVNPSPTGSSSQTKAALRAAGQKVDKRLFLWYSFVYLIMKIDVSNTTNTAYHQFGSRTWNLRRHRASFSKQHRHGLVVCNYLNISATRIWFRTSFCIASEEVLAFGLDVQNHVYMGKISDLSAYGI